MRRFRSLLFLLAGCGLMWSVAGCALTPADVRVNPTYEPVVHEGGGRGDLYLANGSAFPQPTTPPVQWIIGAVKDSDGKRQGNVVTDMLPSDLVMQAFAAELKQAGYTVLSVKEIPPEAAKGIYLRNVVLNIDEMASVPKVEGNSSIKTTVDVWRGGKKVRELSYETGNSDTTVTHRDEFLPGLLQKSLQSLMQRAIPELVRILEQ